MNINEINGLIDNYNLEMVIEDGVEVIRTIMRLKPEEIAMVKSVRNEIIAEFKRRKNEEQRIMEERTVKIKSIIGLEEIKKASRDIEKYYSDLDYAMERGTGVIPSKPTAKVSDLMEKYPRASAYIKAEAWVYASNYKKSKAGRTALKKIINGEDYEKALEVMELEWSTSVEASIWD